MCCIMGALKKSVEKEDFIRCFNRSARRGPDMTRVVDANNAILGFHRLAIMDMHEEGMQPFTLNGNYVICNGEIYGFRKKKEELMEEYAFISNSDCEILLPLYEKYGYAMFSMLDAEYALIIYDNKKDALIAARDPIGIRPLFYGKTKDGSIVFASEAACLSGLTDKIIPFPPGHYYADGRFVCYSDIAEKRPYVKHNIDEVCRNIHDKLIDGVRKRLDADAPVGFLLSGGLDSSLVCSIAAGLLNKPIKTFAIGMSEDAIDLKYAKQVAEFIKSDHTEVIITRDDVLSSLEEVIYALGTYDITTIRASMGMYLLCKYIHKNTEIRVLLTGEISDEIFGYKYTDFAPNAQEFEQEAQKRLRELYMYDVLRADRCISDNSLEARVPFGDLDFVKYVMSIPGEMRMNKYGIGKYILRRAFEGSYLPQNILYREKAAFSDAVGHSLTDHIKSYADKRYTDDVFISKCKQYEHAAPFTKESLLYREIFESHYPGQAEMICGFWMPNKNWEGCNVNDPSARVLANYGASGE